MYKSKDILSNRGVVNQTCTFRLHISSAVWMTFYNVNLVAVRYIALHFYRQRPLLLDID